MEVRLDGKVALVSGGTGNLGKALARRLAESGAKSKDHRPATLTRAIMHKKSGRKAAQHIYFNKALSCCQRISWFSFANLCFTQLGAATFVHCSILKAALPCGTL